MKNINLTLLLLGLLLSSCGTSNRYSSAYYEDATYYRPPERDLVADVEREKELSELRDKTISIVNLRINNETSNEIVLNSENDTVLIEPYESYEELIRKFDDPEYNLEISVVEDEDYYYDDPWYSSFWHYGWYNPRYSSFGSWRYGYSWYNPWYSPWQYSWHNPWFSSYWDPWYYSPGYSWHYGWHDPYYMNYYGYWGYNPYFGYYNPYWYSGEKRDVYYGKRDDPGNSSGGGSGVRSGGSYLRRTGGATLVEQVRGGNGNNQRVNYLNVQQNGSNNQQTNSIYRRDIQRGGERVVSPGSRAVHNTDVVRNRNSSSSVRNYRPASRETNSQIRENASSSSSRSSTGSRTTSSSYERRSSSSSSSTYTPPPANNSSSSSSSSSSGSSSERSTQSSGGSIYRR